MFNRLPHYLPLFCLTTLWTACGGSPAPTKAPLATSSASAPALVSSAPSPASASQPPPVASSQPAALPDGRPIEQSAPPGIRPLDDEEAKEAQAKCKPLQSALTRIGQAAKKEGRAPVDAMLLALQSPTPMAGVDVARCAQLVSRDLQVYRANLIEAEAKKVLKTLALGLSSATERLPAQLCPSAGPVPSSLEQLRGAPFRSDDAAWAAEGWKCLRFSLAGTPQSFQYEVKTEIASQRWEVTARGFSSPGHPKTELYIRGKIVDGKIEPSSAVMRRR